MQIQKIVSLLLLLAGLSGCKENLSYSYLVTHPIQLKDEVIRCQKMIVKTPEETVQCQTVIKAANAVVAIANEQQENPEQFGQKILDTQIAYAKAKAEWKKAQQTVMAMKAKNGSSADLQAAQQALDSAHQNMQKLAEEVKMLLAVAGLSSPE